MFLIVENRNAVAPNGRELMADSSAGWGEIDLFFLMASVTY